jgi:hypothetical protein
MQVHLTKVSSNAKTGPIPVSTTEPDSCPGACPLKNGGGCYAESGPLLLHWRKVGEKARGSSWEQFCSDIAKLPAGQLWRHNQAGDLPGRDNIIDREKLNALVRANKRKRGFTYSHYPMTGENLEAVRAANAAGFTINASANNDSEAMALHALGLPTVTIATQARPYKLDNGIRVAICPAQKADSVSCATCQLCQKADRSYIIGFIPHGTGKKRVINLQAIPA